MAEASDSALTPEAAERSAELASASMVVCALTGERLFSRAHPHELVEDGLAYRVRGDLNEGLARLATQEPPFVIKQDFSSWPVDTIDVVHWAGLKQIELDKTGFIRRWTKHVQAVERHILSQPDGGGEDAADAFLLNSHDLAIKMMHTLDEHDFVVGASEREDGPFGIVHYLDDDAITPQLLFLRAACADAPAPALGRPLAAAAAPAAAAVASVS